MTRGAARMTDQELWLAAELQDCIPLDTTHPFAELAVITGMDEGTVLMTVNGWLKEGLARRFGAVVRHQQLGRQFNVMTVWNIEGDERTAEVAGMLASFPQVTHCYERERRQQWPYNLYAMIHGQSQEECMQLIQQVVRTFDLNDYLLLESMHEYKKESLRYFPGGS